VFWPTKEAPHSLKKVNLLTNAVHLSNITTIFVLIGRKEAVRRPELSALAAPAGGGSAIELQHSGGSERELSAGPGAVCRPNQHGIAA